MVLHRDYSESLDKAKDKKEWSAVRINTQELPTLSPAFQD